MLRAFRCLSAVMLPTFLIFCLAGTPCRASDSCGHPDHPSTYHAQPGDEANSTHFTASRSFDGLGSLQVNVCAGELHIVHGSQDAAMRLEISSPGADKDLSGYVQDFRVDGKSGIVSVDVPSKYHPVVTIVMPALPHLQSQLNLGAGTLTLRADALRGEREVNVGAGTANIYLDGDRDYATLEVNVGMGKVSDERPHGTNAYFVVSRSMQGSGSGNLQVNVGAGSIDLKPAQSTYQ